jgi:hypothetical protein
LLEVPIDASKVSDFKLERAVKVAVFSKQGQPQEQLAKLNAQGKGSVTFAFPKSPGSLQMALGPETVNVPPSSWRTSKQFTLPPSRFLQNLASLAPYLLFQVMNKRTIVRL